MPKNKCDLFRIIYISRVMAFINPNMELTLLEISQEMSVW